MQKAAPEGTARVEDRCRTVVSGRVMRPVTPRRRDVLRPGENYSPPPEGSLSRFRYELSWWLELALMIGALAWIFYLGSEIWFGVRAYLRVCGMDSLHWLQGCPQRSLPWRSLAEFVLIGLFVWWPLIRSGIRTGHWN